MTPHLGQYEGRSQFMTWAYTVAVRQLMRTRKRQLESAVKGAEAYAAALDNGLADRDFTAEEAEYRMLAAEVRISCTYGMLLCLSRPVRASYVLGDAMGMPDTLAAEICGITPAAQRQRLARARKTMRTIIAERCGLVDPANPCRCSRQIQAASPPDLGDICCALRGDSGASEEGDAVDLRSWDLKRLDELMPTRCMRG
jgi:DNA-directed RNA polymerase specialized sigma24 family protein